MASTNLFPTKKRNVFVLIQTRDLNDIRSRIESELKKFDSTYMEVMPGVWHVATTASLDKIFSEMVGAVTDWEDDRVLIIENSDGFAGWDGHKGQYVRSEELMARFVRTHVRADKKVERVQRKDVKPVGPPEWVKHVPVKRPSTAKPKRA